MNKHLNELIELSKNDRAIDSYTPELKAADKKVARVKNKIDTAQAQWDELSAAIASNKLKVSSFEEQLTLLNEQLKLNTKKIKDIKTEKEMKALSLEEDIAKEKMTFANEEIDRLQNINETKTLLLDESSEKVKLLTIDFNAVNKEVSAQKAKIEKIKRKLFTKRERVSRKLEQKVLAFYEKIRIWAGNTAVVEVKKQACYGCYMKLNDKTYSEVIRADDICTCPHCGRILYIENIAP